VVPLVYPGPPAGAVPEGRGSPVPTEGATGEGARPEEQGTVTVLKGMEVKVLTAAGTV
jgi:hypothetical protein